MTATPTMTIASDVLHEENSLDPRIFAVIDEINDDETYQRIVHNIPFGLDSQDVLLITSMLNIYYPPTDPHDVAECLGDGTFTVIVNPTTRQLEWESDSTRYDEVGEWTEGENAFGYRPPDCILVEALKFDGTYIRFIDSPTDEMKLTAVQRTSAAIQYIENPSDAVRQAAATRATTERAQARAAFSNKYGTGAIPEKVMVQNAAPLPVTQDFYVDAAQEAPTCTVQGIASLNYFSFILMSLVIALNDFIGNDERHPEFTSVTEMNGGLVLSFGTMQQLFLMRDMFLDALVVEGLIGEPGLEFNDFSVIAYLNAKGPGFVTWGRAAAVERVEASRALH